MQNPLETIRAAHDLTIELGPTTWRLYNGVQKPDQPGEAFTLVDVRGDRIDCAPAFARARRLPNEGRLVPADIARVVVGWAPESRNWHLGLLLAARPDSGYRMRWCGLASWPSGHATEYMTQAKLAGQSLARIIERPFRLVPAPAEPPNPLLDTQPMVDTLPLPTPAEQAESRIALQGPPFEFEDWTLVAVPKGLVWQRYDRWVWAAGFRILVLLLLAILFAVLGLGARTSGLARVQPAWLPWLGLGVALLLAYLAARQLWTFVTLADVIIDTTRREVRRQNRMTGRVEWRVPFDAVAYVLLSQTPAQAQGQPDLDANMNETVRITQAVWLHVYDGQRFWPLVELEQVEGRSRDWRAVQHAQKTPGRRGLRLLQYDTPAHHAAKVLANTMETDLWLDVR
ncbi:MAG: hypothetical protein GXY36_16085 [Chloroflexi bacterium]|nr:hypothetical protein [Chloroflexota bacterium]